MLKKAFIILFVFCASLSAQFQFKIDSLKKLLTLSDENVKKVHVYLDLCEEYNKFEKPGEFLSYLKKAELLANKLNYDKGKIRVKINYGKLFLNKKQYNLAVNNYNEALNESEKINYTAGKVLARMALADYYGYLAENVDLNKSLDLIEQAVKTAEEAKDTLLILKANLDFGYLQSTEGKFEESIITFNRCIEMAHAAGAMDSYLIGLNLLGLSYYEIKDLKKAIAIFNSAFDIVEKKNEKYFEGYLYNNFGICFGDLGLYEKSLESYLASLKISTEFSDSVGMSTDFFNLADIYLRFEMYEKALQYYSMSLEISEKINSPYDIAYSYNGLAEYYLETKDYQKALYYYQKSLNIWEKLSDKLRIADSYLGIADTKKKLKNYEESFEYYTRALQIYEELNLASSIGEVQNGLGELYLLQKDYSRAESFLQSAYNRLDNLEIKTPLLDTYKFLSDLYSQKNDFASAFRFQEKYIALKDTFFNKEKQNKITGAEIKFELAEKNRENELLKKENKIQELELEKTSNLQLYLSVISFLALLMVVAIFYAYRTKVKSNRNLKMLNGTKDKFISIISHDIKNPIYSIMAYSDLMISDYKNFSEKEVFDSLVTMNNSANNLHKYLNEILTWYNAQKNQLKINPDKFNLSELVERVFSTHNLNAKQKEVTLQNEIDNNIFVCADKYMIEVIVTNLVNNAIKFTNAGGKIFVKASVANKKVEVSVVDNGIGIPNEDIPKLFRIDENYSNRGTKGEEGTGLGLILCKEFVEKNGGEIRVKSTVGKGSSFIFTIPATA